MLGEICAEIKNYFCKAGDIKIGDFCVIDHQISPSLSIADGQYYRIVGSIFNDGVHESTDSLVNEGTFHGSVWLMRVPQEVIDLAQEIKDWTVENAKQLNSPYTSESFGGYSYSISSGSGSKGRTGLDWKSQASFASRLDKYRRIRVL